MTNITLIPLDEINGQFVQLIEIVTRIGYLPRLVSKPSDSFENTFEIPSLLRFRVGVIESKITPPTIMRGISEVHKDGFRVTNVEETIGFWRESSVYETASSFEVFFSKVRVNLRVSSDFVKMSKEALCENISR